MCISGMDNLFFKSVYCLSGLGIVRKNGRIPQHFNRTKNICTKSSQLFKVRFLFFLYDPLTTSLHGSKKSIVHGAI